MAAVERRHDPRCLHCTVCGTDGMLRRSRLRIWERPLRWLGPKRPFRCYWCHQRSWHGPWRERRTTRPPAAPLSQSEVESNVSNRSIRNTDSGRIFSGRCASLTIPRSSVPPLAAFHPAENSAARWSLLCSWAQLFLIAALLLSASHVAEI